MCAADELRQSLRREFGSAHEEHQRAEGPRSGRSHEMQAWNRGFESGRQLWKAIDAAQILAQLGRQKGIFGYFDLISRAHHDVVYTASAAIVKLDLKFVSDGFRGSNRAAGGDHDSVEPVLQPP